MPARKQNSFIKKYSFALYLLGGLFVLWIILEFLGYGFMKGTSVITSSPAPSTQARTFTASEVMGGFTIDVPEGFEVEEKFNVLAIKQNGKEILVTFSGTDYKSLQEVINNLNRKTGQISYLIIDSNKAAVEILDGRKAYYIYKNYALYSISTDNSNFYSYLDQIAQSFRLPGN